MIPLWWLIDIFFATLLLLGCIVATCTFIFGSRRVTLDTIFAAVVVYLIYCLHLCPTRPPPFFLAARQLPGLRSKFRFS